MGPGDVLADKYRVERVLGEGGMGVVVAAEHIHLRQKVAIKYMQQRVLNDEEAIHRFLREARSAVALKSEHVGRVIDVGQTFDGAPYMVMEYLDGQDLSAVLRRNGPLQYEAAADYVLQACVALAEAHARGMVHRDIKPGNLFLTYRADGTPLIKVLDFGVSKASAEVGDLRLTRTTEVIGSPMYMSPEQLRAARDVDARADIWALGVVLYELVAGRLPFAAETFSDLRIRIATEDPTPLEVDGVPERFATVIRRCLRRDPEDRYPSVAELAIALAPHASHGSRMLVDRVTRALDVGTGQVRMPRLDETPLPGSMQRGLREARIGRFRIRWLLVIGLVVIAGGLALLTLREPSANAPRSNPPTDSTPASSAR